MAKFEYSVDSIAYMASINYEKNKEKIKKHKRYLIVFPEGHESAGSVLIDHPVPDDVEAPTAGWDEIPAFD